MSSAVREALEGFLAGRLSADRFVALVAAAYYREAGDGRREALSSVMHVIERAAPGVVELAGTPQGPGFDVRLAERPFPARSEPELREAAVAALAAWKTGAAERSEPHPDRHPWLWRLVRAVRRLFSASA